MGERGREAISRALLYPDFLSAAIVAAALSFAGTFVVDRARMHDGAAATVRGDMDWLLHSNLIGRSPIPYENGNVPIQGGVVKPK